MIGYAYSTLLSIVRSIADVSVTVAESLNGDLCKACEWCDLWGMTFGG